MNYDRRIEFLYQSLSDTQGTIRGLDVKSGFLFVINILPLSNVDKIHETVLKIYESQCMYVLLLPLILMFWVIALYALFKSVTAIDDPNNHINGGRSDGYFYLSNEYNTTLIDSFINRKSTSKSSVDTLMKNIPKTDEEILRDLVYEQLKLAYIRDIKIKRTNTSTVSSFCWLLLTCLVWAFYLFKVGV